MLEQTILCLTFMLHHFSNFLEGHPLYFIFQGRGLTPPSLYSPASNMANTVVASYQGTLSSCIFCLACVCNTFPYFRKLRFLLMIVLAGASEQGRSLLAKMRQAVSLFSNRTNELATMRSRVHSVQAETC
jgi:hypothetical protein